jgi:monoterpene epsilon-lactone hydrolase
MTPDYESMGDDADQYQIRVNGHLGPTLLEAFPALVFQQEGAETVLTGLPDAAALYGVLAEIEVLGLDLLEVRKVRPPRLQDPG